MCFPLEFWKDLENPMTFWKSNIKNCSFGCFFYAFMGENWMTKMLENWEVTDSFSQADHDLQNKNLSADAFSVFDLQQYTYSPLASF